MAPKKLDKYFSKLPKEIQVRIFNLSVEARVVRSQWESVVDGDSYKAIYRLSCGPVPKVLHINRDSRYEGLKSYTLIKSRAALTEAGDKRSPKDNDNAIYINLDIDTIYFVNFPDTHGFLSWFRRIPKEPKMHVGNSSTVKKVEKRIKNIAFNSDMPVTWSRFDSKLDVWYGMVLENPQLEIVTIVFGKSSFNNSKVPHTFGFKFQPSKTWRKYPQKKAVQGSSAMPAKTAMPPMLKPGQALKPTHPSGLLPAMHYKPVQPPKPSNPGGLPLQQGGRGAPSAQQMLPNMYGMPSQFPPAAYAQQSNPQFLAAMQQAQQAAALAGGRGPMQGLPGMLMPASPAYPAKSAFPATMPTMTLKPGLSSKPTNSSGLMSASPAHPAKPALPVTMSTMTLKPGHSLKPSNPGGLLPAMSYKAGQSSKPTNSSGSMPTHPAKPAFPATMATMTVKPGQSSKSAISSGLPPIKYAVQAEPEGRWVPVSWVGYVTDICDDFFESEKSKKWGTAQAQNFRAWRETEEGKVWTPPKFEMMSISIVPKKHVLGG